MTDQPDPPIQPETPAENTTPAPEVPPTGSSAGEAWVDVVDALGGLGDAISTWATAAADTPENRKRLEDVRTGLAEMARQANEAFSAAANSDLGRQVAQGATQVGTAIGSTAQEFGQAAAPHVASAFAGLADAFGRAAEKVGEAAAPRDAAEPSTRPAPEPPAAKPVAPQPPEAEATGDLGDET